MRSALPQRIDVVKLLRFLCPLWFDGRLGQEGEGEEEKSCGKHAQFVVVRSVRKPQPQPVVRDCLIQKTNHEFSRRG